MGYKDDLNLYAYTDDDLIGKVDHTGQDAEVVVKMYAVFSSNQSISSNHAFVQITDTKTGQSWIARGGADQKGLALVIGSYAGTLKVTGELKPVAQSQDTQVIASGNKQVITIQSDLVKGPSGKDLANKGANLYQRRQER